MPASFSPLIDTRDRVVSLGHLLSGHATTTIFDCGASVGKFTTAFLREFPNATVHAFEPHPSSVEQLHKSFHENTRVIIERSAVGDFNGVSSFQMNHLPQTSSLKTRPVSARRYYPESDSPIEKVDVAVMTLDDYCSKRSVDKVDLLKMDIQGSELAALRGSETLLREQRIEALLTEVFFVPHYEGAALFHEICLYLADFNYSLFKLFLTREGLNGQLRLGDAVFISPRLRKEVVDRFPEEA